MNKHQLFFAEEYEQNIPLSFQKNRVGYVHSIFQNGVNISLGGKLFFIGTTKSGRLPFGIHMQHRVIQQIISSLDLGHPVVWNPKLEQLLFEESHVILSLQKATPFKNKVGKRLYNKAMFTQYFQVFASVIIQHEQQTGLYVNIEQFIYQSLHRQQIENDVSKQIILLMDVVFSENEKEIEQVLRYFLGRGKGLTPSGDDHLIGLLAINSIVHAFQPVFLSTLKKLIDHERITTDVSKEYLQYALEDKFSSSITNLLNDLVNNTSQAQFKQHIINLLSVGHSSGVDTAFGMIIGIIAMRRESKMAKKVVIALGGNAILQPKQEATFENQLNNVRKSSEVIARIIKNGHKVIITHGNGPQVGNILRQHEEAKEVVPPFPLDVCSAESQGFIGYMVEQTLKNELLKLGLNHPVVNILTETEVSKDDPAFRDPSKPIGVFYTEEEAKKLAKEKNWIVKEDAGRGWRRVVASPLPMSILTSGVIKQLTDSGTIVVAAGGGGIPVVKNEDGSYTGIEAVIDKDRSGFKLAEESNADVFMILTDVKNVFVHYGKPEQKALQHITVDEAKQYVAEGQFSAGSMGPKMEAAIHFAELGGRAIICSLDEADVALEGKAGTQITKS